MKSNNFFKINKAALAPMAGITDRAFREICAILGAGYFTSEMISAKGLIYNSEKTLGELGDKISGEEKEKITTEIEATKKALEGNNTEAIKEATEKLTKVFYDMSEQLYKNANPNAAQGAGVEPNAAGDNGANDNGNVYDADYKVEDDDNK